MMPDCDPMPGPRRLRGAHPSRPIVRASARPKSPPTRSDRTLGTILIAAAVLLAAVLVVYSNSYAPGWVLDNRIVIHDDPRLQAASWTNLKLIFTQDYWYPRFSSGLYRPLTTLTYLANAVLAESRSDPTSYHLVNNLLHALNALLVFLLCWRLTGRVLPALGAGLVFATHPIATEAVTNLVGRADVLATAAVLSGMLIYIHATAPERSPRERSGWLVALFAVCVVGLLSKESAIALPAAAALYDVARLERAGAAESVSVTGRLARWFAGGYFVFVPAVLTVLLVRHAVLAGTVPNEPFVDNPLRGAGFWIARLTAVEILGRQFCLLVWPARLSSDYAFNQIPLATLRPVSMAAVRALLTLAAAGAVGAAAFRVRVRHPAWFYFTFFTLVSYLPVSNLIVLIGSNMAERFMYLPLAGFAGAAGLAFEAAARRLAPRRSDAVTVAAVVAACAMLGVRTWQRNLAWADELSLSRAAVLASPDSFSAHEHLATAVFQSDPSQLDAAVAEDERSVAILDPLPPDRNLAEPYVRLATLYAAEADRPREPAASAPDEASARRWLEKSRSALEQARTIDRAFNARHRALEEELGRPGASVADAGSTELYALLSAVYERLAEDGPALEAAEYLRHLAPVNPASYVSVGTADTRLNRRHEAEVAYLQAALLDPSRLDTWRRLEVTSDEATPRSCPLVVYANQQPRLNADCPAVRAEATEAFAGIIRILLDAHDAAEALEVKHVAIRDYGVPIAALDRLIPG